MLNIHFLKELDDTDFDDVDPRVAEQADDESSASKPSDEPHEPVVETTEPSPRQRKWPRRVAVGAVVVLIAGLSALSGYLGWQSYQAKQLQAAGDEALRTANSYAVTLTSVDTNNLDANFKAVLDGSTGEFRDVYAESSTQLRQLLIDHKATGHGLVVDSAIKSVSTDEVVVLLFVDQTVTNTEVPDPRVDRSRIVMTMQKADGQWKAAKVDIP
ncbi:DUF3329 domain-containing protein [Mycolicibacterium sp. XJ870]